MLANVGKVVTSKQVDRATNNIKSSYKSIKDLKEDGYNIQSKKDRWDLRSGEFILVDTVKTSKAKHLATQPISKETRAKVLIRDGFTCKI